MFFDNKKMKAAISNQQFADTLIELHVNPELAGRLQQYESSYRSSPARQNRLELPLTWYLALGGERHHFQPILTAWITLFQALLILDREEDVKRLTPHPCGQVTAVDLNTSTALLFSTLASLHRLEEYGTAVETAVAVRKKVCDTMLRVCSGQHQDLTLCAPSLQEAWTVARDKSAALFGLFFWCAARMISEDNLLLTASERLGEAFGLIIQASDDFHDLWSEDDSVGDIAANVRTSIAISYAFAVLPSAECEQLAYLIHKAGQSDTEAEEKARQMIFQSGAALYLATKKQLLVECALDIIEQYAVCETALTDILNGMNIFNAG